MKKFLAVLVVVALTAFSAVAFADVTMSGSVDIRSRALNNTSDLNNDASDNDRYTQSRVRINMDAKVGDAKGKITIQNGMSDWEKWGGVETPNGPFSSIREAWIETPFIGGTVLKAGHQMAQLGHGWFLRNMKYGDDAWILIIPTGVGTFALADAKVADLADDNDADFYAGLGIFKMGETTIGVDLSHVVLSKSHNLIVSTALNPAQPWYGNSNKLDNLGVNVALVAGPVTIKAEVDLQSGTIEDVPHPVTGLNSDGKYKGNQIVVQGNLNAGPAAVNFTVARGSGDDYNKMTGAKTSSDVKTIQTFLDGDPHVALIYEYILGQKVGANASPNAVTVGHGFANTTAIAAGADFKVANNVTAGATLWWLMATEDISQNVADLRLGSNDLGIEIDGKVNWKLNDAVSWNWVLAYFMPGEAYDYIKNGGVTSGDEATAIQGVLSMKFQ